MKKASKLADGAEGHSLGAEAHAEAGQVTIGEGEEDHEDNVPGVMGEQHGQVLTRLDVAQHEEGDEDDPQPHQDREPDAVFTRLQGEPQASPLEQRVPIGVCVKRWGQFLGRRLDDHVFKTTSPGSREVLARLRPL